METTIVDWGYIGGHIGMTEKKMETIIMGLYRVGEYGFHSAGQGKLVHIVQQQLSKIRVVLLFICNL